MVNKGIPANAHNKVVAGENAKKWYVVEEYDFGTGRTDEQIYPYADKTMALAAIPLHYSQFVDMFNQLGWEVVEGCCEDDGSDRSRLLGRKYCIKSATTLTI